MYPLEHRRTLFQEGTKADTNQDTYADAPSCANRGQIETIEHAVWSRPGIEHPRQDLRNSLRRSGCSCTSIDNFIFIGAVPVQYVGHLVYSMIFSAQQGSTVGFEGDSM